MTTPERQDDPFEVLGLPRRFDLEPAAITKAWLVKSAASHPDRQPDATDAAREMARLNAARQALTDPERRANALLRLLGGPSKEADRSLPDGFLERTLELREEIEELLASGESGERDRLEQWALGQRAQYVSQVSSLFAAAGSSPAPEALAGIRVVLNAWRYTERLIEQLDPAYNPAKADFAD